jgi:hypothetical protein
MTEHNWQSGFYWHVWHRDQLLNFLTAEQAKARHLAINTVKPKAERPERNLRFRLADISSIPAFGNDFGADSDGDSSLEYLGHTR